MVLEGHSIVGSGFARLVKGEAKFTMCIWA